MSNDVDIRAAIKPKSDQLNYENFIAGPQTFTVSKVTQGDREHPVFVQMVECPATLYKPSKGMLKCIANPEGWGDKSSKWVGRSITLYGDPTVVFGGVEVGGIKVSHLSDIESDYQTLISVRRGVRKPHMIRKLVIDQKPAYPAAEFDKNLPAWRTAIAGGKFTAEQVIGKAEQKGVLSDEQKAAIRAPITEEAGE